MLDYAPMYLLFFKCFLDALSEGIFPILGVKLSRKGAFVRSFWRLSVSGWKGENSVTAFVLVRFRALCCFTFGFWCVLSLVVL